MHITRRGFCGLLLGAPLFMFSCGEEDREKPPVVAEPPSKASPVLDPEYPSPPPAPVKASTPEADVHAEGTSGVEDPLETDIVSALDDLYDRAGSEHVEVSYEWLDLFGQPAVVSVGIGDRLFEDCLYFEVDDHAVLGADAGVLMAIDRSNHAITWWCGAERLAI